MTERKDALPRRTDNAPGCRANPGRTHPADEETAEEFVNDALYRTYNYTPLDEGEEDRGQNG